MNKIENDSKKSLAAIQLQDSELRNLIVLFMHPDSRLCEEFEARAEQEIPRVKFYSTSTHSAARDIIRKYDCNLAIFQDGVEGKDFVFTQLELKNTSSSISMIPLIGIPTINQISAQHKIGGIFTFGDKIDRSSFKKISEMISNFVRSTFQKEYSLQEQIEYGKTLQNFLFATSPSEQSIKLQSGRLVDSLILNYDLNGQERIQIITAEMLYSPDILTEKYSTLLTTDKFLLSPWLSQTASWKIQGSKPTGTGGFCITLANYLAWKLQNGEKIDSITSSVFQRPSFLMHPSIRALDKNEILTLLEKTSGTISRGKAA